MPRDGSGNYTLPTATAPIAARSMLSSSQMNANNSDIAAALTGSLSADGQTKWTGAQQANGQKLSGLGAPSAATDAATLGLLQQEVGTAVTTVSISLSLTAAQAGVVLVNATAGSLTIYLPAADSFSDPTRFLFARTDTVTGNTVTIAHAGSDTILPGAVASVTLATTANLSLVSDAASHWLLMRSS